MGLDSTEILMEVEKTFNISIPNNDAEKIITVGDFHNCVLKHIEIKHSNICTSQHLFYTIRQSVFEIVRFPKDKFGMYTSLNDIFPRENRRMSYFDFAKTNNLQLPKLILPSAWRGLLTALGFLTIAGSLIAATVMIVFFDYPKWILLFAICGILLTKATSLMLNFKRTTIEPDCVKDFVQKILLLNYKSLAIEKGINQKEVEIVINHIIAGRAGLDIKEITPEKKIGDDLGID